MNWSCPLPSTSPRFLQDGYPTQSGAEAVDPVQESPFYHGEDGSDGEEEDEEEEEEEEEGLSGANRPSLDDLESNIFQMYGVESIEKVHLQGLSSHQAISKVRDLLVASRIGAISCLICLEKVRRTDPIWDCKLGCHAIYHLICIQAWATETCRLAADRATLRLPQEHFPLAVEKAAAWHCPKCRLEYTRSEIPRKSKCFCGKVDDPPVDFWLTAHSCGQICGNLLVQGCGHDCKLLCHPGPCPPCPQLVTTKCHCGAESSVQRCGHKEFSCGRACGKGLICGIHKCEDPCHPGDCASCKKSGLHSCRCGRIKELHACSNLNFSCEQPCDKPLQCKRHICKKICHYGACGECELQGRQRCPCGKVEYKDMPCDAIAPTCGSTCEKLLACSLHRCQERCHTGSCQSVCRVVISKVCRCGSLRKEVPCHQSLQCERKCQRLRDCKRHPCKRRCCSGDCPPCPEICGRRLRCGNHKCPAPCHGGICAPCPLSVRISCACGATAYEVPCGAEKDKKPPRCRKPCPILPPCQHDTQSKLHRCHYGACPECTLDCNKQLLCGHPCSSRCHGPRPPANPEFSLVPKKRQKILHRNTEDLGSPCPPCQELIVRKCMGVHVGGERTMVCAESLAFSCGQPCGNPLACGNHTCQRPCHVVTIQKNPLDDPEVEPNKTMVDDVERCESCVLTCQKERVPSCPHPCMQACHSGDCSPCMVLIKRPCYCRTLVHVFECSNFNSLSEDDREKQLSCGGPCHRKLPNCQHMCPDICHPGPCKTALNCRKKVTVKCACLRLKKEWYCCDVQAFCSLERPWNTRGVGLLACNDECTRLAQELKLQEELEPKDKLHQRKAESIQALHTEKPPRRHRRVAISNEKSSKFEELYSKVIKWMFWLVVVLGLMLGVYYGICGLQLLSNWMNERDSRRPRRLPRGTYYRQ